MSATGTSGGARRTQVACIPQRRERSDERHNTNLAPVANSIAELHARVGDAAVFLDERGQRINGQWTGSPPPVEHDILTGSNSDGMLIPGMTCADWISDSAILAAQVGHSDGMGPNQSYCFAP